MQVNNNVQSPNFGMALKIKPSATEYLTKESKNTLDTLGKLGEEFKDYKHWDLVVDNNGYHVAGKHHLDGQYTEIGCPKDFSVYGESFSVPVKSEKFADAGKEINKIMTYDNRTAASDAFDKIKNANYGLDRTAAFVRELETISAKKAYEEAAKNAADAEKTAKIDELIHKFATEE